MVWVAFAFLTGVAVIAVLWPLARAPRGVAAHETNRDFYRTTVAAIERDRERDLMTEQDAEAAKAEAARRLLAAAATPEKRDISTTRRRVAALAALLLIPALSLALYWRLGNPDYPDQPLEARLNRPPGEMDVNAALSKIERHLAENPDDARGWEIVAPTYMKLGRAQDAAEAYRNLIRLKGLTADRANAFGQALVFAANGAVTPQARSAFEAAVGEEPDNPEARFFLALAAEQAGDTQAALDAYSQLLREAPPDAGWAPAVRERIARLGGEAPQSSLPNQASAVAAMPAEQREQAIRGMVAGLAARLAENGGDIESWSRLVRAYTVLREPDKAREALADARKALTSDAQAMTQLDALARELGLGG